jgi:predicted RNA-binding Zn-ribbon protein involved in translation (DUF1610 family)
MGTFSRLIRSAKRIRIVLICPDCGRETTEFVEKLRGLNAYACEGDGCGYRFDLTAGPQRALVQEFAETCAKLDALGAVS